MSTVSGVRKKRTTALKSVARLVDCLKVLEGKVQDSDRAQDLAKKLSDLDGEVRRQHSQLVELIYEREEEVLQEEQSVLDKHDDELAELNVRIRQLIHASSFSGFWSSQGYHSKANSNQEIAHRTLQ